MRAPYRQLSEHRPLRRSLAEKEKQLRDLRETIITLRPHTSPALRNSIRRRIRELEEEIRDTARLQAERSEKRRHPMTVYALHAL